MIDHAPRISPPGSAAIGPRPGLGHDDDVADRDVLTPVGRDTVEPNPATTLASSPSSPSRAPSITPSK